MQEAFTDLTAVNYPAYETLKTTWPLIGHVLDRVKAKELGRVLITSLAAGGTIIPHADEGDYADHYERFHIALQSDRGNVFSVEDVIGCGEYAFMAPGELWWFNHKKRHAVFNGSDTPRIHLVIDAVAPNYRRERDVTTFSA